MGGGSHLGGITLSCTCLRKAEKLSYACLKATDPTVIDKYFDLLERTVYEYDPRHVLSTVLKRFML